MNDTVCVLDILYSESNFHIGRPENWTQYLGHPNVVFSTLVCEALYPPPAAGTLRRRLTYSRPKAVNSNNNSSTRPVAAARMFS